MQGWGPEHYFRRSCHSRGWIVSFPSRSDQAGGPPAGLVFDVGNRHLLIPFRRTAGRVGLTRIPQNDDRE